MCCIVLLWVFSWLTAIWTCVQCQVSSVECRLRPSYPDHAPEVRFSTKINLGISGMSQRARGSLESHGKAPVLVQPITCLTWKKMGQWRFLQSCLLVDHGSFKHPAYIVWAPGANVDVTVSLGQKGSKWRHMHLGNFGSERLICRCHFQIFPPFSHLGSPFH